MAAVERPHLRWPFRLTQGPDLPGQVGHAPIQLVEQGEIDDVRQCIHLLMRTQPGMRPLAPDIGVADPTFTTGIDPDALVSELEEMEDRAEVTVAVSAEDGTGRQTVRVLVRLRPDDDETEDAE